VRPDPLDIGEQRWHQRTVRRHDHLERDVGCPGLPTELERRGGLVARRNVYGPHVIRDRGCERQRVHGGSVESGDWDDDHWLREFRQVLPEILDDKRVLGGRRSEERRVGKEGGCGWGAGG